MPSAGVSMDDAKGARILLVEDLPLHRRIIPLRLGQWGMGLAVVDDAEAAQAYLQDQLPDLVLLDVMLPGKDGFTLCKELKADPRTRELSIMMLTELQGDAFYLSMKAMADDYFPKGAQDVMLRTRVHLHLQLQELRRKGPAQQAPAGGNILLATESKALRAQLPLEAHLDGHFMRTVKSLEAVRRECNGDDALLVVDCALGVDKVTETLVQLRSQPATEGIALLLLCQVTELSVIPGLLSLVDDAIWMPMKPLLARHRMHLAIELGQRRKVALAEEAQGPDFPY